MPASEAVEVEPGLAMPIPLPRCTGSSTRRSRSTFSRTSPG